MDRHLDLWDRPQPTARESAAFLLTGPPLACAHCLANWPEPFELQACGNPFLADRLVLVSFCRSCTSFSVLSGDLVMRKPIPWESREIERTHHLMAWRDRFVAEQTSGPDR